METSFTLGNFGKLSEENHIIDGTNQIIGRILNDSSYSIFSAMSDTSELVRSSMKSISDKISDILDFQGDVPYGVFLFGSPSRNEMLPNSDLDIGIVHDEDIDKSDLSVILQYLNTLPFDKIDIANWQSMEAMRHYAKTSLVDGNQAIDAKFIAGNKRYQEQYLNYGINTFCNSLDRKFINYICEDNFLHKYDYPSKVTENGPNLKYEAGASRDLIFFNWYASIISEFEGLELSEQSTDNTPTLLSSIEMIENKFGLNLKWSIEIINIIKNTAVECSKTNESKSLRYFNDYTIQEVFNLARVKCMALGINDWTDLQTSYVLAKTTIQNALDLIGKDIIRLLKIYKGNAWAKKFDFISGDSFLPEEIAPILKNNEDPILQNIALWKINNLVIDGDLLSKIVNLLLKQSPLSFPNLMAILAKKELQESDLVSILDRIFDIPGYEYLLRLLYKHCNSSETIRNRLSESILIDSKYKSVQN